ncbi:uncharacterized protein LOC131148589 [Malania oleifera]|uniref:uncharacterized protein LOC131148589 n=1 Tax=Malania oleifera TaxID=397392 RepID=UPI0025AEC8B9|nr:uncharacterized protein LOC131148589 [Malania oleifera]
MGSSSPATPSRLLHHPILLLLLFCVSFLLLIPPCHSHATPLKVVDLGSPVVELTPSPLAGYSPSHGSKDIFSCERILVAGMSRFKLTSYASSFRVTLVPSVEIPERLHNNILVCFHGNASLGPCQCRKDDWKAIQRGLWNSFTSPYVDRFVDVKLIGKVPGSVTVSVEEEFQPWRLICLAVGFAFLLLAPVVSSWVPFYYSSSMVIGVFLVIIILLFQGMKLLPTGRKNVFYLTIYGSVLGAGSFLLHHFSMLVNSILVSFGLSEEMHHPVSIFLLIGIVLSGAAFGYWMVRKFVILEDGTVDIGTAQFVKWAMRIIAAALIMQSTIDIPLSVVALVSCWAICFLSFLKWKDLMDHSCSGDGSPWSLKTRHSNVKRNHAEFLRRSAKTGHQGTAWNSPKKFSHWSGSPVKGVISPSKSWGPGGQLDYYSTFHKTAKRKKFSKKEWDDFTRESTRKAMAEWASSPEFSSWIIENADRIQVLPEDSSDETIESESESSDETAVQSGNRMNIFKW